MIRLGKRGKYALIAAGIIAVAAAGTYIENHSDDAFIIETSTVSDDEYTAPLTRGGMSGGKININTATAEELAALEGIGETLSERIIAFRTENGPFATTEGIMLVDGIGSKMFEDIEDKICVE